MKNKNHLALILATTCLFSSAAFAKKTVAELLSQANEESRGAKINLKKNAEALPQTQLQFQAQQHNLEEVKPPKSSAMLKTEAQGEKGQYVRVLDQQIQELYKLTQKFKNSVNRGEMWLRLAELYVEKATIIDSIKQDEYDANLKKFQAGQIKKKPVLDTVTAREYNRKAVQLYEWFERDFPRDEKISQALFFLGFNNFELGNTAKAVAYYEKLTKQYPNSQFVQEAWFALGEYYFENEKWSKAYNHYATLIKNKNHRLNTLAMYKGAWCLYRIGKNKEALHYLEYIIKSGRQETGDELNSHRSVNRGRLENEALRDIVPFYAAVSGASQAKTYFSSLVGGDITPYLEKLAYFYSDKGDKDSAQEIFKQLISVNPTNSKSFEYQYQIVQSYFYAKNTPKFRDELFRWINDYGPASAWYAANKNSKELIDNSNKLRETTLRNYVLQNHQTAQNSRAPFSQGLANDGYQLYIKEFPQSSQIVDMHFYYGELLYDMAKYDDAAIQYQWVLENGQQSKFSDKAAANLLLAIDKNVPEEKEFIKKMGTSVDPLPLDLRAEKFIKTAKWYIEKFPRSEKIVEIKFRIGRLYYLHNHFDEATASFKEIVQSYPNTKHAEYSANLLLDIFNLRKDYAGLEKTGTELLTVPTIAASKAGADIRGVLEKASFKKAQDLETQKKYSESAQQFEAFAKQNPKSNLASMAMFNAGVNYERIGANVEAIGAYNVVLASKEPSAQEFKPKSKRLLAKLYHNSAQLEAAAHLYRQAAAESPQDPLSPNMIYNAAVIYQDLGRYDEAAKAYADYLKTTKKQSESVDITFELAEIYRKSGQNTSAINKYKEYANAGSTKPEKVIESYYWVTELNKKIGNESDYKSWRTKTLNAQKKLAGSQKTGAKYAAKLRLQEAQEVYAEFKAIKFPADPKKLKKAIDQKAEALAHLRKEIADVIKYDSGEEVVSALVVLGQAYHHMGDAFNSAPVPKGLSTDEEKQYREKVDKELARPRYADAKESFRKAVEKAWELEAYSDSYKIALDYMNQFDSKLYYNNGEIGSDIRYPSWMGQ